MRSPLPIPLAAGVLLGALFVRERHRREAAERFGAASLETLLKAIDANDPLTGGHVRRVAAYALILASAAGLDEDQRRAVERVALFHDIGKIHEALFDVIHEQSTPSRAERRAIATHPRRGAEVLSPLTPFYPELAEGVFSHHERWDGSGYPRGIRGAKIPLVSRTVTLADAFDAITHRRRYRHQRNARAAANIIRRGRGTQFDPVLVDLMLSRGVFARIVKELRAWKHQPPEPRAERREGRRERHVPSVTFRWRTDMPSRHVRASTKTRRA
jgi:HD-GYP domain-containing protein (c-di-GMP phosphodiesterase class II)